MKRVALLLLWLLLLPLAAQPMRYSTHPVAPEVRTLQVQVANEPFAPPLIALNGDQSIRISFDRLVQDDRYYSYTLVHCNANWQPSALSELEYIDGFNTAPIGYEEYSYNTFTAYTHYEIELPNSDMQLKASGNYALRVYPDEEPDSTLLYACFSVYEQEVDVTTLVTAQSDVNPNRGYQQLEVGVNFERKAIASPHTELKLYVSQNGRSDNEVVIEQPLSVTGNLARYAHTPQLIFEAGNEYRRFEIVSLRYAGLGVEKIAMFEPFYHVTLFPTTFRAKQGYSYDQTQQGRYLIRQSSASDNDLESDYFVVHFALESDNPFIEGAIYLNGYFTYNQLSERYQMKYNFETKRYEADLLLKQGSYNYQYLYLPHHQQRATAALVEGNYSDTCNEYLVKVFYRPFGANYDQLIGVGLTHSCE